MRRPRIFLDANILVDAQIRDIFFTIAEARLIELRWSNRAVTPFGLSVLNADSAIAMLIQDFSDQMPAIISRLLSELRKPPITVQEFLDRLKQRTPTAAQALSAALKG